MTATHRCVVLLRCWHCTAITTVGTQYAGLWMHSSLQQKQISVLSVLMHCFAFIATLKEFVWLIERGGQFYWRYLYILSDFLRDSYLYSSSSTF